MRAFRFAVLAACSALPLAAQHYFPPPPAPAGNRWSQAKELLGMALYWEEQLSSSNTVACGTCHQFRAGGADPRLGLHPGLDGTFGTADDVRGSPGVRARDQRAELQPTAWFGLQPQVTRRKAPSVLNAAYSSLLFYDGRAANGSLVDPLTGAVALTGPVALENQALQPILNATEMGHPGRTWNDVTGKLQAARPLALARNIPPRLQSFVAGRTYPALFQDAFGSPQITPVRIAMAIATYERTLISDRSPYDDHLAGVAPLTGAALRGLQVFTRVPPGGGAACIQCHGDLSPISHATGPLFETTTPYGLGTSHANFHNTGVRPIAEDPGRQAVTGAHADRGKFKVPLLRDVALRAPFFHNNGLDTLAQVVDFYDRGGDFHVNQAIEIQPLNLTAQEKSDLVAFLQTLTDPRVASGAPPFDAPSLGGVTLAAQVLGQGMTTATGSAASSVPDGPVVSGERYEIAVAEVAAGQPAFVLWDPQVAPADFFRFGLRFRLALSPALFSTFAGSTAARAGLGYARTAVAVPGGASLLGATLYGQWAVGDPAAALGLVTSDAFELVVR